MAALHSDAILIQEVAYEVPNGVLCGKMWGNPDAPKKMIAIHGWLDNAGSFDGLLPLIFANGSIQQDYNILALDLPGHGLSSNFSDACSYNYPEYAICIKRVIEKLGWSKLSLMGHSLGGGISLLLSISIFTSVERLIIFDEPYCESITPSEFIGTHLKEVLNNVDAYTEPTGFKTYSTLDDIVNRILTGNKYLTEASARLLAIRGSKAVENGYTFTRDLRLKIPTPMKFLFESPLSFTQKLNNRVCFPSLFLLPAESEYPEARDFIKQGLKFPDCVTVQEIPGTHHVHLNQPEIVAPIIIDFIAPNDHGETSMSAKL